jgi:hypothetical protein
VLEINAKLVNSSLMATCPLQTVVEINKHNSVFVCFLDVTEEYSIVEVQSVWSLEVLVSDSASLEFLVAGL